MKDVVRLRVVAGSAVVTIPQDILRHTGLQIGDRLLVETGDCNSYTLKVTKEEKETSG